MNNHKDRIKLTVSLLTNYNLGVRTIHTSSRGKRKGRLKTEQPITVNFPVEPSNDPVSSNFPAVPNNPLVESAIPSNPLAVNTDGGVEQFPEVSQSGIGRDLLELLHSVYKSLYNIFSDSALSDRLSTTV